MIPFTEVFSIKPTNTWILYFTSNEVKKNNHMSHKENKVYIKYANIKFIFIHIYKEKDVDI